MLGTTSKALIGIAIAAVPFTGLTAPAGNSGQISQMTAQELIRALEVASRQQQPQPSVGSFGANPGFGMPQGSFSIAASVTDKGKTSGNDWDGSMGLAVGLGDPRNAVGLDVTTSINSTALSDFAEDGSFGVKLHKLAPGIVPGGVSSVAVGVSRALGWGSSDEVDENYYGAFSTLIPTSANMPILLTVGYGNKQKNFGTDAGAYAGIGVGFSPRWNASASWTGDQAIASLGFRPFLDTNLTINAGIGDVTDREDNRRALLTVSWFTPNLF